MNSMNIKELRIGNYVYPLDNNNGQTLSEMKEVFAINPDLVSLKGCSNQYNVTNIKPVPIDRDILEMFGFKVDEKEIIPKYMTFNHICDNDTFKNLTDPEHIKMNIDILNPLENFRGIPILEILQPFALELRNANRYDYYTTGLFRVKYLHHLQNIYFDYTGKELKKFK